MGSARSTRIIGVAFGLTLLASAGPVAAQGPAVGATAPPSATPGDVMACPVTVEQASKMAGTPMLPDYPDGGTYVQSLPRAPGLEDETTTYTCGFASEATGASARRLFLQFAVGDSADWLWELNGPSIVADPTYVPLVDGDPGTPDSYRQVTSFEADGEAFLFPMWQVRDYLQANGLFADIIVDAAGDTQAVHDQATLMASLVGLAIAEATTTP